MAALTADRNTPEISGDFVVLAVAAGVRIFAGSLVCIDNAGRAVPGGNAGAVRAIGRAEELADNRLGAAGAINVKVARGIFGWSMSRTIRRCAGITCPTYRPAAWSRSPTVTSLSIHATSN